MTLVAVLIKSEVELQEHLFEGVCGQVAQEGEGCEGRNHLSVQT